MLWKNNTAIEDFILILKLGFYVKIEHLKEDREDKAIPMIIAESLFSDLMLISFCL